MGPDLALEYEETANSTLAQGMQPGMALFYRESHFPNQSQEYSEKMWGNLRKLMYHKWGTRVHWEWLVRRGSRKRRISTRSYEEVKTGEGERKDGSRDGLSGRMTEPIQIIYQISFYPPLPGHTSVTTLSGLPCSVTGVLSRSWLIHVSRGGLCHSLAWQRSHVLLV